MDRPLLRIRVSDTARSAVIGHTRDANIEGCFLCTPMKLRLGDLLPISLQAEDGEVQAEMEVVRVTDEGVGLRIRSMPSEDRRRFRRMVASANSVVGTRNAAARVLDADRRTTPVIADPDRIREVLESACGARLRLVAAGQDRLWEGGIERVIGGRIQLQLTAPPQVGTPLLAVLDSGHANYAFSSVVLDVNGGVTQVSVPTEIGFAERRSRERRAVDSTTIELPLPWAEGEYASFPVNEVGPGGLSFQASADRWLLGPGSALSGARIRDEQGVRPLAGAVVASVDRSDAVHPGQGLRVGVLLGSARRELVAEQRVIRGGKGERWRARLVDLWGAWTARFAAKLKSDARAPKPGDPTEQRVRFNNRAGVPVVGLLDFAFPEGVTGEGTAMPLVLIVPGRRGPDAGSAPDGRRGLDGPAVRGRQLRSRGDEPRVVVPATPGGPAVRDPSGAASRG